MQKEQPDKLIIISAKSQAYDNFPLLKKSLYVWPSYIAVISLSGAYHSSGGTWLICWSNCCIENSWILAFLLLLSSRKFATFFLRFNICTNINISLSTVKLFVQDCETVSGQFLMDGKYFLNYSLKCFIFKKFG